MDTDRAYISNANVVEDMLADDPIYSSTEICTCREKSIEKRNAQKKFNLNRLVSVRKSVEYSTALKLQNPVYF